MLKFPTFEEINGIKEKLSIGFKERNPNEFNKAINLLMSNVKDKKPTKAHKVLADLQIPIITMNIDGLHQMAGSKKVYELHGSVLRNTCTHCQTKYSLEDMMKLRDDEGIPRCPKCVPSLSQMLFCMKKA